MNTEAVARAGVEHTEALGPASQQAVLVLHAHETREPAVGADARGLVDLLGREVAAADLEHLARAHQLVERAERLLERRRRVGKVQLVQVDAVGAEAAQAVFDRARDVRRARTALALLVDRTAELRRDDRLVATRAERAAEDTPRCSVPP